MEKRLRLFHEDTERCTEKGLQVEHEITEALKPILTKLFAEGYSTRDVENLMLWLTLDLCVEQRLNVEWDQYNKEANPL